MNVLRALFVIAAATGVACALSRGAEKSDATSLAELEKMAKEAGVDLDLPTWDISGFIEAGAGYNDNVLLAGRVTDDSSGTPVTVVAPDGSAFVRAEFSALALRMPQGGFDGFATIDVTSTRFFSAQTDDAQLVIFRSEARWQPRDPLRLSLAGQFVYDDEVIDTSTIDSGFSSLPAKFGVLSLEPAARWSFADRWTAGLKIVGSSNDFRPPLYDYREFSSELSLSCNTGRWGEFGLTWTQFDRRYRDRPQAEVGGRPLQGTRLFLSGGAGELRYELRGGAESKWRLRLKAAYFENRDDYSGWYDYSRRSLQAAWSYEGEDWRLETEAAWRGYDYDLQTVGFGDPPRRDRKGWTGRVRFERDLRENLSAFVEVEGDRNRSNDIFLDYRDVVSVVGLRWSR